MNARHVSCRGYIAEPKKGNKKKEESVTPKNYARGYILKLEIEEKAKPQASASGHCEERTLSERVSHVLYLLAPEL